MSSLFEVGALTGRLFPNRKWGTTILALMLSQGAFAAGEAVATPQFFDQTIHPLTQEFCFECHSAAKHKGGVDLEHFTSLSLATQHPDVLQRIVEELRDEEMPPDDARRQPTAAQLERLQGWAKALLDAIALENAGDPGPVVLRRLSNAEYTYTIRDLTRVQSLDPVKEFPEDGAAGEGFTNTGQALVMSSPLLRKYIDAAKGIASHAVLLPDGIRFSSKVSRLDWSNEIEAAIRNFYRKFADMPADKINFEGFKSQLTSTAGPKENGRLPLEKYLTATLEERDALRSGSKTLTDVAEERQLSPKYLKALWKVLTSEEPSFLLDGIRKRWGTSRPEDAPGLVAEIAQWQKIMWKFDKVGALNDNGDPKPWMEPVVPLAESQEVRLPLTAPTSGDEVVACLAVGNAGDTQPGNFMEWEEPRLIRPGRPTVMLRDTRDYIAGLMAKRDLIFASTIRYLTAAAEARESRDNVDVAALAERHQLDADALKVWLDYLGIDTSPNPKLDLFTHQLTNITGWDFIRGWGSVDAPGLVTNSTDDQHVLIPGTIWPHAVMVHPSDTQYAAVGWRSPVRATLRIEAKVTHVSGGKGVTWSLQLRHGRFSRRLATGLSHLPEEPVDNDIPGVVVGPVENVAVEPGDLVSLLIGARSGISSADHTILELKLITSGNKPEEWSLSRDVSSNVLAGNPHADSAGRNGIWSFYSAPVADIDGFPVIPAGSLITRWLSAGSEIERQEMATALQQLLTSVPPAAKSSADAIVRRYLTSLGGPFFASIPPAILAKSHPLPPESATKWGLNSARFGRNPKGSSMTDTSGLVVEAPSLIEIRLPAELFAGGELVATAKVMPPGASAAGTVQAQLLASKPQSLATLEAGQPILTNKGSSAWDRLVSSCGEFNQIFPAALCYTEIRPTDETITLEIFHRDDRPFVDLMLDDTQKMQLDRLWDELHYVNRDVLALVDTCESMQRQEIDLKKVQLPRWPRRDWLEKAAKSDAPSDFGRIVQAVNARATAFRERLLETQSPQLKAVLEFADRAYRRPLSEREKDRLQGIYHKMCKLGLSHDNAIRLTIASVLVSPDFLYRSEDPGPGVEPVPISQTELASRLSYFLWSSAPDDELRTMAAAGRLSNSEVLITETRRMLKDPRVRHLATEFGCEWLRIHDFDQLDDKSARSFPTFAALRGAMYEETILYLTDLFKNNRPVLKLLDSNYTFLNEDLAKHYGIPGVIGPQWRKVDGIQKYARGGILAQATFLTKQSGASRTSPILRGSWIVEVLLGTKLPKPPTNVPQLPEDEAAEKLTVRELTDRHVSDPRCSGCHARFNAFGYALENFDAIGRFRVKDLGNRPINTKAKLNDGTELEGFNGLREYLLTQRKSDFVHQFCRKLLGYAVGRSTQLSDEPLLREMETQLAANDYRVDIAIELIVGSRQFREIRGRDFVSND